MTTGEIIDTSLKVYQALGPRILRVCAFPALLCLAAEQFFNEFVAMRFIETSNAGNIGVQLGEFVVACAMTLFAAAPIAMAGVAYASIAAVKLTSDFMLAKPADESGALKVAQQSLGSMVRSLFVVTVRALWAVLAATTIMAMGGLISQLTPESSAVAGIVAFIGVVGLLVGIVIWIQNSSRFALIAPVMVLERLDSKNAIARSQALMKRDGPISSGYATAWGILGMTVLLYLLIGIGLYIAVEITGIIKWTESAGTLGILGPILGGFFYSLPSYFGILLALPFPATALTILYYDRRVRMEGYDIDALNADAMAALPRRR